MFDSCLLFRCNTHTALYVLQFWQNVQGEPVSLPSRAISSIHEVAKCQHQAKHLQYTLAALESLVHTHTNTQTRGDMQVQLTDRTQHKIKRAAAYFADSLKDFNFPVD